MRLLDDASALSSFLDEHDDLDCVLWDFDGVVVDSEPVQAQTYREILTALGHIPAADFFDDLTGRTEAEIWAVLINAFGLQEGAKELREERLALVTERLVHSPPNWFLTPLLEGLERRGVVSRIVSSGNESVISRYLGEWNLSERFRDVSAAAADGSIEAKQDRIDNALAGTALAMVIEDSSRYLAFARSRGAVTLAVRHSLNQGVALVADALVEGGPRQ